VPKPQGDLLTRPDGAATQLFSEDLAEFGLDFLAHHANWDRYFTDSGGSWTRSPDPLTVRDVRKGRTMVLVHPIHWRAAPRQIYVMSPARSGSTWLARVADRATNAKGLHEVALNHKMERGAFVAEKRTHQHIDAFINDTSEVRSLLGDRRAMFLEQKQDIFECNVYLAHVAKDLRDVNPDAALVRLMRDPKEIIVSILNRGWYETNDDHKHPAFGIPDWSALTQIEKCAHYVGQTHRQIMQAAPSQTVSLRALNDDPDALKALFQTLGLAFYPRLAADLIGAKVNQNTHVATDGFEALTPLEQSQALAVLETYEDVLGAGSAFRSLSPMPNPAAHRSEMRTQDVASYKLPWLRDAAGLSVFKTHKLLIVPQEEEWRRKYRFVLPADRSGAFQVSRTVAGMGGKDGVVHLNTAGGESDFEHREGQSYTLDMSWVKCSGTWQVLVPAFDRNGVRIVLKRAITELKTGRNKAHFTLPAAAKSFRIALYGPGEPQERQLQFNTLTLSVRSEKTVVRPLDGARGPLHAMVVSGAEDAEQLAAALVKARYGIVTLLRPGGPAKAEDAVTFKSLNGYNLCTVAQNDTARIMQVVQALEPQILITGQEDVAASCTGMLSNSRKTASGIHLLAETAQALKDAYKIVRLNGGQLLFVRNRKLPEVSGDIQDLRVLRNDTNFLQLMKHNLGVDLLHPLYVLMQIHNVNFLVLGQMTGALKFCRDIVNPPQQIVIGVIQIAVAAGGIARRKNSRFGRDGPFITARLNPGLHRCAGG